MKLEHSEKTAEPQHVSSSSAPQATRRKLIQTGLAGAPVLLAPTAKGEPGVNRELLASLGDESSETAPPALRVWVPSDIEGLRASDPAMGRRWRLAAREVFTALFEAGYRTRAVDRDGHYVFTREA